jgi:YidC/Oxa1 family membrane protein insertase
VISTVFHTLFYNPIYNALVALTAIVPGSNVGVAIIIVTLLIRLILLPLSLSAARTQRVVNSLQPKLKELKEKHKGDREKEATETLALYREAQVNPFASLLTAVIQIPVLLALYFVFLYEPFSTINTARLYSVTPVPAAVSLTFLGVMVIGKSLVFAVIAGFTQFVQAKFAFAGTMKPTEQTGMQADFQKVLGMQFTYVFPLIIGVVAYTTSAAIGLYLITTNIAGALQELYVRRALGAHETPKS